MEASQAKKLIITSAIVTFTLGIVNYLTSPKNAVQGAGPIIGFVVPVGFVYFMLSAIADFSPGIAGPMALLIMTASILYNGQPFLTFLTGLSSGLAPRTTKGAKSASNATTTPTRPTSPIRPTKPSIFSGVQATGSAPSKSSGGFNLFHVLGY